MQNLISYFFFFGGVMWFHEIHSCKMSSWESSGLKQAVMVILNANGFCEARFVDLDQAPGKFERCFSVEGIQQE